MNKRIAELAEEQKALKERIEELNSEQEGLEEEMADVVRIENLFYSRILQDHFLDILEMIKKRDLFLDSVINLYCGIIRLYVTDGAHKAEITVSQGTVRYGMMSEQTGAQDLYREVEDLIKTEILPFCDEQRERME